MKIYSDNFPVVASNYEKKDSMWLDNIIGFSTEVPVFQCITTFYEWDAEFYDQTASLGGKTNALQQFRGLSQDHQFNYKADSYAYTFNHTLIPTHWQVKQKVWTRSVSFTQIIFTNYVN